MESKIAPDAPDPNPNLIHTQVLDPEGCLIYHGQIKKTNPNDPNSQSCYHGEGNLFYPTGNFRYQGSFKYNEFDGPGREYYTWPELALKFEGTFKNAKLHG
jgi:antitoxin component YwqK of YwqJK toxin-antitoxin module